MEQAADGANQQVLVEVPSITVTAAFDSSEEIAAARDLARTFLTDLQAIHGLPVSERVMGTVQLVVSELVTNARKYAPGPCELTLHATGNAVNVTLWDSEPALPIARTADCGRVGQHGLEIVLAVSEDFTVHREPVGKRVTAAITLADEPDSSHR
ncbi:ATP-binding protein [Streptomyces montanisoli]|uniref:ATP-binding protein n=1 Tax=Streptomyces montanisoli TaxID=2798581 RepID=A0A940RTD2_9ACTN|nr:ATP-binding protein [Streptomyces montanisoli]MBP0455965.1 ATP-binding protein [Streptomyces montanisoli]